MANTYLQRSKSSPTSDKKGTISFWIKRSDVASQQATIVSGSGSNDSNIFFDASSKLNVYDYQSSYQFRYITTRVFRDPSAWYHIVVRIDTTDGTAGDRVKIYVNGTQETAFDTSINPSQNLTPLFFTSANPFYIGAYRGSSDYTNGLYTHFHYTDGYAYDALTFGETDSTTGEWKINTSPSVSYGTNGFFILKDGNSVTDQSGNSNNFSVGGGTLTKTEDNPSNVFATGNPLSVYPTSTFTFSKGNLEFSTSSSTRGYVASTLGMTSGKYYFEYKATNNQARTCVGIAGAGAKANNDPESSGAHDNVTVYLTFNGQVSINSGGSTDTFYNTATSSDNIIIGCALDLDSSPNTIAFSIDGEWVTGSGTKSTDFSSATKINSFTNVASTINGVYHFIAGDDGGTQDIGGQFNFGNGYFGTTAVASAGTNASGNGIFEYDVPTGYTALSTKGLNT